jgi:hypothetical protein
MEPVHIRNQRKEDLINFPVWRHWAEGGDEKAIPENIREISESTINESTYIVLTEFTLNNNVKYMSFCSPQDFSGLDYVQPVLLTDEFQITFFKYGIWTKEEVNEQLDKLQLKREEVFPLSFETKISCDGQFLRGIILDFESGF